MAKFPEKAYNNREFLNSAAARHIRILCEYEETRQRFLEHDIQNTLVFFGSARARPPEEAARILADAERAAGEAPDDPEALAALRHARGGAKLSRYYADARALARRLTAWSTTRDGPKYVITSGGGPGIMEAANRGAADVEGGQSIGLGISLPFELGVNDWVSDGLDFEFHYFFTRKYWFLYPCKGLVIFPGGFGTLDELFETVTLIQTRKIAPPVPVVLYGSEYWSSVFNLDQMVEYGTISPGDPAILHRADTVDEAFDYLTGRLEGQPPGPAM